MLKSHFTKDKVEAGCDEAGRGCLAGPVHAAAVIFPKNYKNKALRDSKKLTEEMRDKLAIQIKIDALSWAIGICSPVEIDKYNILNASFRAMHKALRKLTMAPELILVDGNRFNPYKKIPYQCIIKGDDKYLSIAAAGILAKVTRDQYMKKKALKFPQYHWITNKGYPTRAHRDSIAQNGITPYHRKSFQLLPRDESIEKTSENAFQKMHDNRLDKLFNKPIDKPFDLKD